MSELKKKKRRKKTTSIGSGRSITQCVYDAMLKSYLEHRSVKQAALDAGVAVETSQKYIDIGTEQFPAIRPRVDAIMVRAREEEDDALVHQRHFFQENLISIAEKAAEVLPRLQVVPRHQFITDDEGEIVTGDDGKPLMAVDEVTLSKLVDVFGKIAEMVERLGGTAQQGQAQQINVHTSVHIDHDAVKSEVQGALKSFGSVHSLMVGTEKEEDIRSALAKEAQRRITLPEMEVLEDE